MAVARFFTILFVCASVRLGAEPMRDVIADYLPPHEAIKFYELARLQTEELLESWRGTMEIAGKSVFVETRDGNLWATVDGSEVAAEKTCDDFVQICKQFPICRFDILFPFLSWDNFAYDGPANMMGRRAQRYVASPPENYGHSVAAVKIWIDDTYGYPLSWEVVDEKGHTLRRFRVRSLKKDSSGEWTVSTVEFSMPRDRKQLHVKFVD
ncbi:MAG: hypothetical protein LBB38_03815 [Puniceicoccales bacterium]|jgi:hypothetical protein|nr:hypothetical protein [Puniceicoccales bacterium]